MPFCKDCGGILYMGGCKKCGTNIDVPAREHRRRQDIVHARNRIIRAKNSQIRREMKRLEKAAIKELIETFLASDNEKERALGALMKQLEEM